MIIIFDKKCSAYLLHRFEIHDLYHWLQILGDSNLGYIFHQDYAGNISCSPKFEPEDTIFLQNKHSYIVLLFMIIKKTQSMCTILVIIKDTTVL